MTKGYEMYSKLISTLLATITVFVTVCGLTLSSGASILPKFGSIVKDGDLSFRPTNLVCNIRQVGSGFFAATPTGQYCRITLWIYNHSKESDTLDITSFYAADKKHRQYPGDDNADSAGNPTLNNGIGLDFTTLNPGLSITGFVYFDMPKGDSPTYLIFHDSFLSNGVEEKA